MDTPLTIAAVRFTDDVPRMRSFLETLGLSVGITRDRDWAVMQAGAGQVMLHSVATSDRGFTTGATVLTGETEDVGAPASHLTGQGLDASVVDEAYARSLEVADPLGSVVVINETQTDTYGSSSHTPAPDPAVEVVLSRFTEPDGPYLAFVTALGLRPLDGAGEGYAAYGSGRGVLGLHHDDGSTGLGAASPDAYASLALCTGWSVETVQQRLSDAGFGPGAVVRADFGDRVETTGPDGRRFEIHHR